MEYPESRSQPCSNVEWNFPAKKQRCLCTSQRPCRGVDPGEPPGICTETFANSTVPRANILPQKATTVPPPGSIIWRDHSDRFLAKNIFALWRMDGQQKGTDLKEKRKTRLPFSPSPFWKLFHAVRIFHFQDGGDVTNPVVLSHCIFPRKCKSGPMPPSRAKNWRQKSASPALFLRRPPGSTLRDGRWWVHYQDKICL